MRKLEPSLRDAVLRAVGEDALAEIGSAGILTWLPAEHHARIFDAIWSVLGRDRAIAFWRDAMSTNLEQPLLRPLVQGGMRLFGATVYSIIRMSPRAWSLVARDCGTHLVSRGEGRVELRMQFVDVPRVMATLGFVAHCIGNCDAVLRLLDLRGETTQVEDRLTAGRFSLAIADVRPRDLAKPTPSSSTSRP